MVKEKTEGENKSDGAEELEAAAERVENWTEKKGEPKKSDTASYIPKCPRCHKWQSHVRIRTGEFVCHMCGNIWLPGEGKKSRENEKEAK